MRTISLTVNNKKLTATVEPRLHLADFLRETQNLTGTHLGCEHGTCGACTLLIDGVPARSCITYAVACDGANITTIEGFDDDEIAKELRQAFSREHALQCGYCTPGMLVSARDLVIRAEQPNEQDIRIAMNGNLCRCTGYVGIVRAIQSVIASRRARGIVSIPNGGRTVLGPVGSGHAMATKTAMPACGITRVSSGASHVEIAPKMAVPLDFEPQVTFDQNFSVAHPRDQVWTFFSRLPEIAACLPGAALIGEPSERNVEGKIRIKVGPIAAEFHGVAEIERDSSTYTGTIRGSGRDTRSSSATRGVIRYSLKPGETVQSTRVEVRVGYTLTGALAQFSRSGLVQDVASRLTKVFAQNLEARLAGKEGAASAPASELNAGLLIFSVLAERIKAWLRRLFGH